ncbi:MAG: YfhO family protein [Bacteroidetes bacterium]|nr:YfhO family protein [Bacteroidota bacterium]
MNSVLKKILPHAIAFGVFLIVAIVFCKPSLEGKVLNQSDVTAHKGMAQQSYEFNAKYGHYPLWTESAFSGMPAYTIAAPSSSTVLNWLAKIIGLYTFNPIVMFVFACTSFYFLTQVLRINTWLAVMSSLAFGYATFDPIIVVVGHSTQMEAIGFMPMVVAGFLLLTQKKYWWGAAVFAISLALQSSVTQHIQIVYYTGIIVGFIIIGYLVKCWKEKQIKTALPVLLIAIAATLVGLGENAVAFLPVQEYAKETMRGGRSELTIGEAGAANKTKGGLDKDYAFMWSYGIPETMTFLIPGVQGGGYISRGLYDDSKFVEKLTEIGIPEASGQQYVVSSGYWGPQSNTAGPVYFGAVICFLFIFGLVYYKGWHKWWIIPVTTFAILLAWGKNFSSFNYFLFDVMPFYNKFRAPTMSLVIPQLTFPLLAALGLDQLLNDKNAKEINWKKFKNAVIIMAGIFVLVGLFYFMTDYKGPNDINLKQNFTSGLLQQAAKGQQPTPEMQQQVNGVVNEIMKGLQSDRQSILVSDLLRSLVFVAIAVVLLGAYLKDKIKPIILLAGLTVLSSYDLLAEGRKYLNEESFLEPTNEEVSFQPSAANLKIKSDPEKNFRVFDQTEGGNAFQDSRASYFHNSIGGYSPAKLGLYQDIIEHQLSKGNMMVYNMLNTKYFIRRNASGTDEEAVLNPNAFGSCWLVKSIHYVSTADEEMKALDSINVRDTAIVRKNFQSVIKFLPVFDSTASIKLIENLNDKISYKFSAKTNQFAVFSEVYYDKGWNAYLDGNKTDYCKVDYILRGMPVPAGDHTIEFRFEPRSYKAGEKISLISSLIGYLLLAVAIFMEWKNRNKEIGEKV